VSTRSRCAGGASFLFCGWLIRKTLKREGVGSRTHEGARASLGDATAGPEAISAQVRRDCKSLSLRTDEPVDEVPERFFWDK
jgi:hypothetical protein